MSVGSRSVAVTGAGGVVGRLLVAELEADPAVRRVLALDLPPQPEGLGRKSSFRPLDLGGPDAAAELADAIDDADVDTVLHLGYLSETPAAAERQEREIGVIVEALHRRPVPKLVVVSTTAVCGALPGDPTHLGETAPLAVAPESEWLRDKVAAERALGRFTLDTDTVVTILRFALVLGPHVKTFMTDYLERSAVPIVIGSDPPVQFLHELDAVRALQGVVKRDYEGVYNIVGDGAVPLSVALRIGRRRVAPLPGLGSYPLTQLLWDAELVDTPAVLRDLFKFVWVADGGKALDEMAFQAQYSTKETIEDFYRVGPVDP